MLSKSNKTQSKGSFLILTGHYNGWLVVVFFLLYFRVQDAHSGKLHRLFLCTTLPVTIIRSLNEQQLFMNVHKVYPMQPICLTGQSFVSQSSPPWDINPHSPLKAYVEIPRHISILHAKFYTDESLDVLWTSQGPFFCMPSFIWISHWNIWSTKL